MQEKGTPISASQVWRIFDALDLKPWQTTSWMTSKDPEFWAKAGDVCGLYLDPPLNEVIWSVDEKTGIQAKSRINPTKPAVPGAGRRQEFEYRRHGTAVLFAGLDVHDGSVTGWVTDSSRSENFVAFLADLCTAPSTTSPLNQVELFFSIEPGRCLVDDHATPAHPLRRVRLRRRPRQPDHRIHQRLQPTRQTIPLDLRRTTAPCRVTHNDLRAAPLAPPLCSVDGRLAGVAAEHADTARCRLGRV